MQNDTWRNVEIREQTSPLCSACVKRNLDSSAIIASPCNARRADSSIRPPSLQATCPQGNCLRRFLDLQDISRGEACAAADETQCENENRRGFRRQWGHDAES